CSYLFYGFFFFQAEDGIRDDLVTGVQTCALPILIVIRAIDYLTARIGADDHRHRPVSVDVIEPHLRVILHNEDARLRPELAMARSEERRVGKECRSRWWR